MIFQGQEFLEDEWFRDGTPLEWDRVSRFAGIVELYRSLCRLRRNWFDTTRGLRGSHVNVYHVNHQDKVLAYHRWEDGGPRDDVVVVVNCANVAYDAYIVGLPRSGHWCVRFNSDASVYGPDFGNAQSRDFAAVAPGADGLGFSGSVALGRYAAVVLSQD
jgi:1,4-alpha-glucan branching enzyme